MDNFKLFGWLVLIFFAITGIGFCQHMTKDAVKTVEDQFSPSVMLKKYEYFKDLSSAIDKKRADIEMYQAEIKSLGIPKDKDDKFYVQQRKSELLGIIAMHNQLCSDYNSAMAKFNYRFCNKGDLPQTNLDVLPREYKPYINSIN